MAKSKDTSKTANDKSDNIAEVTFERAKAAIPKIEDAAQNLKDQAESEAQRLTASGRDIIAKNPLVAVAVAAGVGVLLGVLATKRSS